MADSVLKSKNRALGYQHDETKRVRELIAVIDKAVAED